MIRTALRFLYDSADAALIDGYGLRPDPELTARNLERAREVIAKMGPQWCLYRGEHGIKKTVQVDVPIVPREIFRTPEG